MTRGGCYPYSLRSTIYKYDNENNFNIPIQGLDNTLDKLKRLATTIVNTGVHWLLYANIHRINYAF
jgi:hypothetical protein